MWVGLNYASTYHHYEPQYTPDSVLHRDFSMFSSKGIKLIVLLPHWSYMAPTETTIRETYIDDLVRCMRIANQYGIKVIVDYHTLMQPGSYTVPSWVPSQWFGSVFQYPNVRAAWMNQLARVAERCGAEPNLHTIHMMNEPTIASWAVPSTVAGVDDWINLWSEMKATVRAKTNTQVSVRLAGYELIRAYQGDPRIFSLFDYICLNWYERYNTRQELVDQVNLAHSFGKKVMLSECGLNEDNNAVQESYYRDMLAFFEGIGVWAVTPWLWRADNRINNPPIWGDAEGMIGVSYNLAKNILGETRPCFDVLATYGSVQPPPPPVPPQWPPLNPQLASLLIGFGLVAYGRKSKK